MAYAASQSIFNGEPSYGTEQTSTVLMSAKQEEHLESGNAYHSYFNQSSKNRLHSSRSKKATSDRFCRVSSAVNQFVAKQPTNFEVQLNPVREISTLNRESLEDEDTLSQARRKIIYSSKTYSKQQKTSLETASNQY